MLNFLKQHEITAGWESLTQPSKRVFGRYIYMPGEHPILELEERLSNNNYEEMVNGETTDHIYITLYRCRFINIKKGKFLYVVDKIFFNGHNFKNKDSLCFKSVDVEITYLEKLFSGSSRINFDPDVTDFRCFTAKYVSPKELVFHVDEISADISIYNKVFYDYDVNKLSTSVRSFLRVEPEKIQPYDWFRDKLFVVRNILSIFFADPIYYRNVIFRSRVDHLVDFLEYQNTVANYSGDFERPQKILLNSKKVEEIFGKAVSCYFKKEDGLTVLMNLWSSVAYRPDIYLDFQFLALVQAVEAYYNMVLKMKYMSDEDDFTKLKTTLKNAIPGGIDKGFRDKIENSLNYLNEYSLRRKLDTIIDNIHSYGIKVSLKGKETFINNIVTLRNYFTHYSVSKPKTISDIMLHIEKLKVLVTAIICYELEFPPEVANDCLKKFTILKL